MLDNLQIIFWSITYILIIIAGWRSRSKKMNSMPYAAGILNFGWELCALQESQGFWGHILWLGLDAVIFTIGFFFLQSRKQKGLYIIFTYFVTAGLWFLFVRYNGMLFSVFAIDLIMAVLFLVDRKRLSHELKIPIAVCKLTGDTFAGIFYAPESRVVAVMAIMVFVCNVIYLVLCCREHND